MSTGGLSNLRVLILGCNGQLGTELVQVLRGRTRLFALDFPEVDFTKPDQLRALLHKVAPNVIFNAAAYTAVDAAESNVELAFELNSIAPEIIAIEAGRLGSVFVHYSTDYVFDGTKSSPYVEEDTPAPINVYGRSKLEGERLVQKSRCRHFVFRISWLYASHSKNFYRTISSLAETKRELRVVDDQIGSPTSAAAVARASLEVIQTMLCLGDLSFDQGVFHMTGAGAVSWCGFANAILQGHFSEHGLPVARVIPIPASEFKSAARRPLNSLMDSSKLFRSFGVKLPHWRKQFSKVVAADPSYRNFSHSDQSRALLVR